METLVGPGVCARAAAKKVMLGHVVLFPTYTVLFNFTMSTLEGKGVAGAMKKLEDTWWDVMYMGTCFWPFVNMSTFMFFSPAYRLLSLNVWGLAWNAYMSFKNAGSNDSATAGVLGVDGGGGQGGMASTGGVEHTRGGARLNLTEASSLGTGSGGGSDGSDR
jgi:protein Mpv17